MNRLALGDLAVSFTISTLSTGAATSTEMGKSVARELPEPGEPVAVPMSPEPTDSGEQANMASISTLTSIAARTNNLAFPSSTSIFFALPFRVLSGYYQDAIDTANVPEFKTYPICSGSALICWQMADNSPNIEMIFQACNENRD